MKKFIYFLLCSSIIFLIFVSCSSKESKAKDVVKTFCEACKSEQTDKARTLYPDLSTYDANVNQIDVANLTVVQEKDVCKVDDGANHIFYVGKRNGEYVILDSKNVIEYHSKLQGDVSAALQLGMVTPKSTDLERIQAYSQLQDNTDLVEFLKQKHPEACVYGITVENVTKHKEGGYGIYWLEVKAKLKSGSLKPLGFITVNFIGKDKEGNIQFKHDVPESLSENDIDIVGCNIDLNDYPGVVDVEIELVPFSNKKQVSDIDLLCAYSHLSKQDYKEYLDSKK